MAETPEEVAEALLRELGVEATGGRVHATKHALRAQYVAGLLRALVEVNMSDNPALAIRALAEQAKAGR